MTHKGAERIEFSRPAYLPGVEILLAEHSSRRWRWFHETYTICTVLNGLGHTEWAYRGKVHDAVPGEVLLYEPGEVHSNCNVLVDASFRVLFVPPGALTAAAAELGVRFAQPHWKLTHTPSPALYRALVRLHTSLERSGSKLEVESRFAGCLRHLLDIFAETSAPQLRLSAQGGLARARDFIHENYHRGISLDELSRVAGLSRFHLSRAFAACYGMPPHAYQIALRVAKARQFLAAGDQPLHLAAELGFSDQSHFNRHFQSRIHTTPAQYARMVAL